MTPGRLLTGARTPRFVLIAALAGLCSGCLTPKSDLKTAGPNLRLPKPSNVDNAPRVIPPKPADAPAPVSVRTPAKEAPPSPIGPGVTLGSGHSVNGNLTTDIVAPPKFAPNTATMPPIPVNATYTANPPAGPSPIVVQAPGPVPREAGTNIGVVVVPASPTSLAAPLPPPAPLKVGAPSLPNGN